MSQEMSRYLRTMHFPRVGLICGCLAAEFGSPAVAQSSSKNFYQGKTISLTIGYSAGGGYDAYARLVARFMGDHIPGKPQILPVNMPGASGRAAAAYLYSAAPKDGTALGTEGQSFPLAQAMGEKLRFDMSKFAYIGNPSAENNTTVTWAASGVRTIDDAERKQVTVGATGGDSPSSQYPLAMNAILGAKFKIVLGYPGGNDIDLAMERGEVAGRGSNSWASWKATRPGWLGDHKINILVQIGLKKAADLPHVPLLMDLAKSPGDHAVLKLLSAPTAVGRPLFAPPGTPPDRVDELRKAFDATMKDPAFLAAAKKAHLEIDPIPGKTLQNVVADIVSTPKPIAARLAQILAQGEAQKAR